MARRETRGFWTFSCAEANARPIPTKRRSMSNRLHSCLHVGDMEVTEKRFMVRPEQERNKAKFEPHILGSLTGVSAESKL